MSFSLALMAFLIEKEEVFFCKNKTVKGKGQNFEK